MNYKSMTFLLLGCIVGNLIFVIIKPFLWRKLKSLDYKNDPETDHITDDYREKPKKFRIKFNANKEFIVPLSAKSYKDLLSHYTINDSRFIFTNSDVHYMHYSWFLALFQVCASHSRSYMLTGFEEAFKLLERQNKEITTITEEIVKKLNKRQLTMLFDSEILVQNCLDKYSENQEKVMECIFNEWREFLKLDSVLDRIVEITYENKEILDTLNNFLNLAEHIYQAQFSGGKTNPSDLTATKNLQRVIDKSEEILNSTTQKTE